MVYIKYSRFIDSSIVVVLLCTILISSFQIAFAASFAPKDEQSAYIYQTEHYLPLSKFHLRGLDGPYHTQGNLIYGADNQPYLFHGIARDDLEYLCTSDGHYTQQELAYMGLGNNTAHATYWGGNIVRLPLSESFWLYGSPPQNCTATQYQTNLKHIVDALTNLKLNVMLDLQWTNAGEQTFTVGDAAGDAWSMPDKDSVVFWQQVAPIYKNYSNVLFEIYNEPHLATNDWACWRDGGCQVMKDSAGSASHDRAHFDYQAVGMQTLLDTVRQAGANNLVIVGGLGWGYDLSGLPTYHLKGSNIVYDTHPYPYVGKTATYWDAAFGTVSATYPVISAEFGEYDCKTAFVSQYTAYLDAHNIGWIAWAWIPPTGDICRYPRLVTNLTGTPSSHTGQFIYQYLHSYLALLAGEEIPEIKH